MEEIYIYKYMGIELFITGMRCSKLIDLDAFKQKKIFLLSISIKNWWFERKTRNILFGRKTQQISIDPIISMLVRCV